MFSSPPPSGSSPVAQKRRLRSSVQTELRRLDLDWIRDASGAIVDRLSGLEAFKGARNVLLFGSSPSEVNLDLLAASCARAGKRVGVPRVDWARGTLVTVWIDDWANELVVGRFRIREPREGLIDAGPGEFDLAIVPGLAFDRDGGRLGRGGGFYDRFLASNGVRARLFGVCFDVQIADSPLPREPHDVLMHAVVTESRTILVPETR